MYRKSVVLLCVAGLCLTAGVAAGAPLAVKVNFQLATAQVPPGYLPDSGLAFGDRGNGYTYGWSRDISADSRDRGNAHPDQRYDTLIHFQKGADAIWEIVIPNGQYNVLMVCGDASNSDQTNTLSVEDVIVTDPNGQVGNFDKYNVTVTVADGRLTIKPAPGSSNAKICFVDIVLALEPSLARDPIPANKATDVPKDVALGWTPGDYAQKHNVYLGIDFADVNNASVADPLNVLAGADQTAAALQPLDSLEYGTTYYWRVDEVNAPPASTVFKGDVWSFTVEPYAYPIANVTATASSAQVGMGPERTVDGSGLNSVDEHSTEPKDMWLSTGVQPNWIQFEFDRAYKLKEMWVWNSNQMIETFIGFGAKSVRIEYSLDGATWTELPDVPEFARATGLPAYAANTTVNLGGVFAQYVKLTIDSQWGMAPQAGLSEVRFFHIPVQARSSEPTAAATGVSLDATLNWRPGREAASHTVYLGTDEQAVTDGTADAQTVANHSYTPTGLEFATTYYWRVDEVNEAATPNSWAGDVWSFTTQEYAPVDDFESYTDDEGSRIYEAWIDGWTNNTGAVVGYLQAPFAEQQIIYGGVQSMPLEYNNVNPPYYSEAERTFASVRDWTGNGADTLVVYFQGRAPGFVEEATGNIIMGGGGADIWNAADQFRFAGKRLTGNGAIVAKVESLVNTDPWTKVGVMIRESMAPGSRFAAVYATPDYGVRYQARTMTDTAAVSDSAIATPEQIALTAPVWVKIERSGSSFSGFYSTDGVTWTAMAWNPQTINMSAASVYIGLAVTSHNANALTAAEFSNISTTGSVAGAWEVAEIGVV